MTEATMKSNGLDIPSLILDMVKEVAGLVKSVEHLTAEIKEFRGVTAEEIKFLRDRVTIIEARDASQNEKIEGLTKRADAASVERKEAADERQQMHDDLIRLYAWGAGILFFINAGSLLFTLGTHFGWF